MVDTIFLLSVVTVASGLFGVCIRYSFRSKCSSIKCCWGCYEVTRDVAQEMAVTELERQGSAKGVELVRDASPISNSPRITNFQGRIGSTYDA